MPCASYLLERVHDRYCTAKSWVSVCRLQALVGYSVSIWKGRFSAIMVIFWSYSGGRIDVAYRELRMKKEVVGFIGWRMTSSVRVL